MQRKCCLYQATTERCLKIDDFCVTTTVAGTSETRCTAIAQKHAAESAEVLMRVCLPVCVCACLSLSFIQRYHRFS